MDPLVLLDDRAYQSQISIHAIPDDVLKIVFEEAYQHTSTSSTRPCTQDILVARAHVSHRWRQVVVSLPSLWTCIHVKASLGLARLYLHRSGSLPLSVHCSYGDGYRGRDAAPDLASSGHLRCMELILSQASPRLQFIDIEDDTACTYDFVQFLRLLQHCSLPSLTDLRIDRGHSYKNLSITGTGFQYDFQYPTLTTLRIVALPSHFPRPHSRGFMSYYCSPSCIEREPQVLHTRGSSTILLDTPYHSPSRFRTGRPHSLPLAPLAHSDPRAFDY